MTAATADDVGLQIMATVDRLFQQFHGTVPRDRVAEVVADAMSQWKDARVKAFVPVLAERAARDRLRAMAGKRAS
jgi:protein-tyrosine phosphatase-like protein